MLKFLVIDDDEPIRVLLKLMLKKNFTCLVLEASNGEEGVQVAQSTIPNLILLDIMMPVMDGRSALQRMRENALLRKTPVLVMTA
ncbi:MAG: response regulator, partial [Bacteroidetes bacterium]|nr:response regulator [Bacteroidota bacterium]